MIYKLSVVLLTTFILYSAHDNQPLDISITPIDIECSDDGYPSISGLKNLIEKYYQSENNLTNIEIEEITGGYHTAKMYKIHISRENNLKFKLFFKINKHNDTAQKLLNFQKKFINHTTYDSINNSEIKNSNIPIIIWLIYLFEYKNLDNKIEYIEVTPAAPGETIYDIIEQKDIDLITECAYQIGKAIAEFHQLFMNNQKLFITLCHGDLHTKNILYNKDLKEVYLIDNEHTNENYIANEIAYCFINSVMFECFKDNYLNWNPYNTYNLHFLKGYLDNYNLEQKLLLALDIKNELLKRINTISIINSENSLDLSQDFIKKNFHENLFPYLDEYIAQLPKIEKTIQSKPIKKPIIVHVQKTKSKVITKQRNKKKK